MTTTPDRSEIRAATFLAAQARLDNQRKTSGKVKCNPPNRRCGDRCIPPNWKCRASGEGTDSHSRVVAGDPLAGAASIARGRARLEKGLRTGNVVDIQGGRAAIARGVVKAVPGQNLQQKQDLRKNVEGALLPVATGLFAIWAIRQGHEAAKEYIPQYKNGPAKDIETAASGAVDYVFDRIPFYGAQRRATRITAARQAQSLIRKTAFNYQNSPAVPDNNKGTLTELARRSISERTVTIPQLRDALSASLSVREPGKSIKTYQQFRADVVSGVIGASKDGRSIYAETAAASFLAKQYDIPFAALKGAENTTRKVFLTQRIGNRLTAASDNLRRDMSLRNLDPQKPEDVENYIKIAEKNALSRIASLDSAAQQSITDQFRGTIRELVSPRSARSSFRGLANRMYDDTVSSYDKYFQDVATRVKSDMDPTLQVGAASYGGSPVRSALIGTAEMVKSKVRITQPITGANHAELVLQRVYHEYSVPNNRFNPRTKSTWIATDADIKYAAQDMGWDNQGGVLSAFEFLQRSGQFPRLARPEPGTRPRKPPATPEARGDSLSPRVRSFLDTRRRLSIQAGEPSPGGS